MKAFDRARCVTAVAVLSACGNVDAPVVEQVSLPLLDGTPTSARPEVGFYRNNDTGHTCTVTLISSHWFVTAAHCFNFESSPVDGFQRGLVAIPPEQPAQYEVDGQLAIGGSGLNAFDIGLGHLKTDVPASVATPAQLAVSDPVAGELVTIIGLGCTNRTTRAGEGEKRYTEYAWGPSQRSCPSDSGAPVRRGHLDDGGEIVAINGGQDATTGNDYLGTPSRLVDRLTATMRAYDVVELNMDRFGMDYTNFTIPAGGHTITKALKCRKACSQDARCQAFSFRPSDRRCWLKSGAPRAIPQDGRMSGLPTVESGLNFPNGDYSTFTVGADNEPVCEQACFNDERCRAFTFQNGVCHFKDSISSPDTTCTDCVSGIHRASEPGVDRVGSDYRTVTTSSAAGCRSTCAKDSSCEAYSYASTTCKLKNHVPDPSGSFGTETGVRRGMEPDTDRYGSDYRSFSIADPRPEVCQAACENDSRCSAWTYFPPQSVPQDDEHFALVSYPVCYLKNTVPAPSLDAGLVSGRKGVVFY